MLVIPTQAVENSYVPPPGMVSHSVLGLFILEDWQIDLHPRPLLALPAWLLPLDPPVMVNWWELCSLPWSELPPPEEGDLPEVSLSNCGTSCLVCHLLLLLRMSILLLSPTITHLIISQLCFGSILLQAYIHSSMLLAVVGSSWSSWFLGGILVPQP